MEVDPKAANVRLSNLVNAAKSGASSSHNLIGNKDESFYVDSVNNKIVLNDGPYSEVNISFDDVLDTNIIEINKEDIIGNEVVIQNNDVDFAFNNIAKEHINVKDVVVNISKGNLDYDTQVVNRKIKCRSRGNPIINNEFIAGNNELFDKITLNIDEESFSNQYSNNVSMVNEISKVKIGNEVFNFDIQNKRNPKFIFDDIEYEFLDSGYGDYVVYLHYIGDVVKLCCQKMILGGVDDGNKPIITTRVEEYRMYCKIRNPAIRDNESRGPIIYFGHFSSIDGNVVRLYDRSNKLIVEKVFNEFTDENNYQEFILCDDGSFTFYLNGISLGSGIDLKYAVLYDEFVETEDYKIYMDQKVVETEIDSTSYSNVINGINNNSDLNEHDYVVLVTYVNSPKKFNVRIGEVGNSLMLDSENWQPGEKYVTHSIHKCLYSPGILGGQTYPLSGDFDLILEIYDEFYSLVDKYKFEIDHNELHNHNGVISFEISKFNTTIN